MRTQLVNRRECHLNSMIMTNSKGMTLNTSSLNPKTQFCNFDTFKTQNPPRQPKRQPTSLSQSPTQPSTQPWSKTSGVGALRNCVAPPTQNHSRNHKYQFETNNPPFTVRAPQDRRKRMVLYSFSIYDRHCQSSFKGCSAKDR
jgi:hypothetical protein